MIRDDWSMLWKLINYESMLNIDLNESVEIQDRIRSSVE